jgi:hypothetical protein
MRVIAYPNRHYPPAAETLSLVNVVVTSVDDVATTLSRNE